MLRSVFELQRKLPLAVRRPLRAVGLRTPVGRKLLWREKGVDHELDFWRRWFETRGLHWPDDYRKRLDPEAVLEEPLIADRLPELGDVVSILDVGAGPLTVLGKRYPGTSLRITPVDPLARDYDRLLAEFGVAPPVRTELCPGEELLTRFTAESFDIAYARNSLDHSYDPVAILRNMVTLVRPGGFVLLRHVRSEGEHQSYSGFHQWNFDAEDGHLVLWNRVRKHDVTEALGAVADVAVSREETDEDDWVVAVMKKRDRSER
ncbi:MAG TPA: methyltransferase domain-containing protein [Gaiellaceae bacterium]